MIVDGYCTPGRERDTKLPVDRLLTTMDEAGIARAVIAPEDREIAVDNVEGNRRIAEIVAAHPDRFVAACSVNPWFGETGVKNLREAAAKARMLVLSPALQGFILGDSIADSLIEAATELGVPVYIHTGPHSAAAPSQLVLLAMRLPHARFVMGHCGATDYSHDLAAVLKCDLPNLWYDLSLVRPWAAADLVKRGGGSRAIWGSGAPRNDPGFELVELDRLLPRKEHPDVYGANVMKLLSLDSE